MASPATGGAEEATDGSPDRVIALSDEVYAITMTPLVLDLKVPDGLSAHDFRRRRRGLDSGGE